MSTITKKHLSYRGQIKAIEADGKTLSFVTVHPEDFATELYRLDAEKDELTSVPLPCGAVSLLLTAAGTIVGGNDSSLYRVAEKSKKPAKLKVELPASASHLVSLAENKLGPRLAALCGKECVIIDGKDKVAQILSLPNIGTSMASSPNGEWFVIGDKLGNVSVYSCEETGDFQLSETARVHDSAVTALLFEPDELRFLSAGADQKLLLTHARGRLEPEDRGRGASHKENVTSMIHVPGERFITSGLDKACKSWTLAGATRPKTETEGVTQSVDSCLVHVHGRPNLALADKSNTIRLFRLDESGRMGALTHIYYDAYSQASNLLSQQSVASRGEAIHALASYNDSKSIQLLLKQMETEADHALRLRVAELLANTDHPQTVPSLQALLRHADPIVRLAAFQGLRDLQGNDNIEPLRLALDTGQPDIGIAAVDALETLAKKDDKARELLLRSIDHDNEEVRRAGLFASETVFPKNSPEPTLQATSPVYCGWQDTRIDAILRLYQRKLLDDSRVRAALRRLADEHHDRDDVTRTAFLVSLLANEKLADAVRSRDKDLHRQLFELETRVIERPTSKSTAASGKTPAKKSAKAKAKPAAKLPAAKKTNIDLSSPDVEPLLVAMSSRNTDTCLVGACCLASLGDTRAFGTLLQLSCEEEAAVRVQVCRALEALNDERALQRLETLLDDNEASVRDSSFTGITSLLSKSPLGAAAMGLGSRHADVRSRGLQALVKAIRGSKAKKLQAQPRELMLLALNDADDKVRNEAFKASLNLEIDGADAGALKFVLQSAHASVRREVLTEAMAQDKQPWAQELLVELLNDLDPQLRADAYQHLLEKTKNRDVTPMKAALASRFNDIRKLAVQSLIALNSADAQEALALALDDEDRTIRLDAISSLVSSRVSEALHQAMQSSHSDVRIQAAAARAWYRDANAEPILLEAIAKEEPEKEDDKAIWTQQVAWSLAGLAMFGNPENVAQLIPLLTHSNEIIRGTAAHAVTMSIGPNSTKDRDGQHDALSEFLQHDDLTVRYRIAVGLALSGDTAVQPLVFSDEATNYAGEACQLIAANAYGEDAVNRVAEQLESGVEWIRNAALLVLLIRDWRMHDGTPRHILAALGSRYPRIRLLAAKALERFNNSDQLESYIVEIVNDRGNEQPWTISAYDVGQLADALLAAEPRVAYEFIIGLRLLTAEQQSQWNTHWQALAERHSDSVFAATQQRAKLETLDSTTTDDELSQLAFGTYVGLIREQGGYHQRGQRSSFGTTIISIRQEALRRLVAMAKANDSTLEAARPVVTHAMRDPLVQVRTLAFELLKELELSDEERAEAALQSGQHDMGVAGLQLLTKEAGKKGREILEKELAERNDQLAVKVAQMLGDMVGKLEAIDAVLSSPVSNARGIACNWLAELATTPKGVRKVLEATKHAEFDVRHSAVCALAMNKHKDSFDLLISELEKGIGERQAFYYSKKLHALQQLGDPRTPDAILDLVENRVDKSPNYDAEPFKIVGEFRDPKVVDRLLKMAETKRYRDRAFRALLVISGFDQPIVDPRDELLDRKWMDEQFPRHDDVFAKMLERGVELKTLDWFNYPMAAWSLTDAIDPVLAQLATSADEQTRHSTIETISWRLKHRDGPAEPLLKLLEHRDPTSKFLAAAGLAHGGRDEGQTILLSAIELMSDLNLRRQAVLAVGELADPRSVEVLLQLAANDGHALQDVAAEALGHLGKSERADEIFTELKRLSNSGGSVESRAIIGLRWFNTTSGWDLIRAKAKQYPPYMPIVIEQLGYNGDDATKDILRDSLNEFTDHNGRFDFGKLKAARRCFGSDSLEPDYAVLEGYLEEIDTAFDGAVEEFDDKTHCLRRVCEQGEPKRILEILANGQYSLGAIADAHGANGRIHAALSNSLLNREPLPTEAAKEFISSPKAPSADVAAHLLGRSGDKANGAAVAAALIVWMGKWSELREKTALGMSYSDTALNEASQVVARLIWASSRTKLNPETLTELLVDHAGDSKANEIRRAAANALVDAKLTKSQAGRLALLVGDIDSSVRRTVLQIMSAADGKNVQTHAEAFLQERRLFESLAARVDDVSAVVSAGLDHNNYQAVVLPKLVKTNDVTTLADVAANSELADNTRLGAIEGLARIATTAAEEQLLSVGKDESTAEELRMAAWRGLRRSKRRRAKQANQASK